MRRYEATWTRWFLATLLTASIGTISLLSWRLPHDSSGFHSTPFRLIVVSPSATPPVELQPTFDINSTEEPLRPTLLPAASDPVNPPTTTLPKESLPSLSPLASLQQSSIPRILHQSWKTRERIPTRFTSWMRSWVQNHPDWQYVFWTDVDNVALFERFYPRYAYIARAVPKIALADMARYALLHQLGGVYVDADFECLHPFDDLVHHRGVILSHEPLAHTVLLENSNEPALCNAIMGSVPGHPFWIQALESIKARFDREHLRLDAVSLTGPRIIKHTYETQFRNDVSVTVLPSEYFYPEIAYWNIGSMRSACATRSDAPARAACAWLERHPRGEFTNNTLATHHWQCTWCLGERAHEFVSLRDVLGPSTTTIYRPTFADSSIRLIPL